MVQQAGPAEQARPGWSATVRRAVSRTVVAAVPTHSFGLPGMPDGPPAPPRVVPLVRTAVVVAAGAALPASVPFLVDPLTTAAPAAVLTLLGLAGAAVALRTVVSTDPLTALGSAR